MVEGVNQITKIGIIVISIILAFFAALNLFQVLSEGVNFGNSDQVLKFIGITATFVLCVLAFWGAYTENACLCYISLVACAIAFCFTAWTLIQCLTDKPIDNCIIDGILLVMYGVMVVAVYLFINSIK